MENFKAILIRSAATHFEIMTHLLRAILSIIINCLKPKDLACGLGNMKRLPIEILTMIVECLNPKDLACGLGVSNEFYKLIKTWMKECRSMRFVWKVNGWQIGAWRAMRHFPNLTTVDMSGCTDCRIGRPSIPAGVKTLNFADCWVFQMNWLDDVQSVQCLHMEVSIARIIERFKEYQDKLAELKELNIRLDYGNFDLDFVLSTPKLRKLWLTARPIPSYRWLEPLAALENLVYLSLNSCIRLTDEALLLVSNIRKLETLDISNCPELTEAGIAEVKARMPDLAIIR